MGKKSYIEETMLLAALIRGMARSKMRIRRPRAEMRWGLFNWRRLRLLATPLPHDFGRLAAVYFDSARGHGSLSTEQRQVVMRNRPALEPGAATPDPLGHRVQFIK